MAGNDDRRDDGADANEAFFARWSRRKQQVKADRSSDRQPTPVGVAPAAAGAQSVPTTQAPDADRSRSEQAQPGRAASRPLTEADFKDVDFTKLDYSSDYAPFLQSGVPEAVRQKALTRLWQSDPIFTAVDPFQDYAGDYTDAAVVPKGAVKTAYRIGQGFLSDEEAHTWDRLGKPDLPPEIARLPVLRPGYRVRAAVPADADVLAALQVAAIRTIGSAAYDATVADSWASGLDADLVASRLTSGAITLAAIEENSGEIAGFIARENREIVALFVAPGHGRRGIASCLVRHLLADIETPDAEGVITVAAARTSRALFERQGWQQTGVRAYRTRGGADLEVFDMRRPVISAATVAIAQETPLQPDIAAFFAASEAYMSALYPAESNHFVDAAALAQPHVIFLVARLNGAAVGCGAVVADEAGCGEIKRMWLAPTARGLGLGQRVLSTLEAMAQRNGIATLRLETGIHQPEAINLYRRAGYQEIGPFGTYQPDPLSLFMAKTLS